MEHSSGKALNIVQFVDDKLDVDKNSLNALLLHPEVKSRKVVVVTIVGAFRKGKSFFMDYCLRFLYANYKSINQPSSPTPDLVNWIGDGNEKLTGFSWRAGVRRDTTGITFWSDVFLHDSLNEKLAIVVVDSQGLFDNQTTAEDNSKVFSISTLLTSQQILNLSGVVQEDHLQYLQFATEFATFAASSSRTNTKPFQNFMFLIRDWSNPDEFPFGIEGGKQYLDSLLTIKPEQKDDLKSVRQHIMDTFDNLSCCLLPYPGKSVARDSTYDGRWSLMDEDFVREIQTLIPELLKPEKLVVKKINGVEMTAEMLNEYFQQYLKIFQESKAPGAQSIYEATVEKFFNELVDKTFDFYKKNLQTPQTESEVKTFLESARLESIRRFQNTKKMGTNEHLAKYQTALLRRIQLHGIEFQTVSVANIKKLQVEEAARMAAEALATQARIQKEKDDKEAQIKIDNLKKEGIEREQIAAQKLEELRLQEIEVQKEIERQRVAEEERQAEIRRQQQIEEDRRREAARIAAEEEEERKRKEKIWFQVQAPHVHIDVPKPNNNCNAM